MVSLDFNGFLHFLVYNLCYLSTLADVLDLQLRNMEKLDYFGDQNYNIQRVSNYNAYILLISKTYIVFYS